MEDGRSLEAGKPLVVGVGASAGGLEAFQLLLKGLPEDHHLVIVLVQHLDPDHESLMPELIAAKTRSPVHSVEDGMEMQPGHIYLNPPGYEMHVEGNRLRLDKFATPRGLRRPIDHFLTSLAGSHGENAIAVILSGTGSDGAQGAREVKGLGGLVFVQDPRQAKYDGMPQSVLDLSGADVTAKAEEVIDVVRDYFSLRFDDDPDIDNEENFVARIMRHVRFRTGYDFTEYKTGTLMRRIAVRMSVLNISTPTAYLRYLVEQKQEADLLFNDLLINVTSFFRDSQHFETFKAEVVPRIVEDAEEASEIRVWIAGCSTGEEAYSVAMLLAEEIDRVQKNCGLIIFATDIDDRALTVARAGRYGDGITTSVPTTYLEQYFRPMNEGYEIGPRLREIIRFSRHSFLKDPPFSKLDLVVCRNVMIYMQENLQELACKVFHYALKEGGYLFVGPSENPKSLSNYFSDVSSRARIYERKPGKAKPLHLGGTLSGTPSASAAPRATPAASPITVLERYLLDRHTPAYIHVDPENDVLYFSKQAERFLALRSGKMRTDLFSIIAPDLETTVRRLSRVGMAAGSTAEREYQGNLGGATERIVVRADRLPDGSLVLVFNDKLDLVPGRDGSAGRSTEEEAYINQLEAELDEAKQEVRTTVEELETSNEELKSSNEEMMSMNEELQSANEELTTINDELQEKLRELNQVNIDLNNFVRSARVPTVFLDGDLCLRRFTPEAEEYFSFTSSDLDRPLQDLSTTLDADKFIEICNRTIKTEQETEREFLERGTGKSIVGRFMPYSPDGKDSKGVVFTLQDVTELRDAIGAAEKTTERYLRQRDEIEQIYKTSPSAMALISKDMRYLRLNEKLATINGEPLENHMGRTIAEIVPDVADHTEGLVRKVFETGEPIIGELVRGTTPGHADSDRVWESNWVPFYTNGEITGVAVNIHDITEQVAVSENLKRVMRELEHRVKNMLANVRALINRAGREAKTDRGVFEKLQLRIEGLSKTHSLLTSEQWSSAALRDIVAPETIEVYGDERVSISGPNIRVNSEATLALGMVLHELATNAAKYGAFSVPEGHVDVSWSRVNDAESDRLVITWEESGGPRPNAPDRTGFGTQLIKSTIEGSLNGKTEVHWEPTGLKFVMKIMFETATATLQK